MINLLKLELITAAVVLFFCSSKHASAQVSSEGTCALFDSKHKFLYAQFFSGTWYVLEGYPNRYHGNISCEVFSVSADEKYVFINDTVYDLNSGTFVTVQGKARFKPKKALNRLKLTPGIKSLPAASDFWIVSTDYESYGVVYICQQVNPTTMKEYIYILSREPSMEPGLKAKLIIDNVVRTGLPVAPLAPVDHSPCFNSEYE